MQNFASVGEKISFSRKRDREADRASERASVRDRDREGEKERKRGREERSVTQGREEEWKCNLPDVPALRESKRRTVETGGKQRVIEKRAPGMWVTFNLLQREKTRWRKNIDNWKVFSFAGRPEMRDDLGPVFDKVFFVPSLFPLPPHLVL